MKFEFVLFLKQVVCDTGENVEIIKLKSTISF